MKLKFLLKISTIFTVVVVTIKYVLHIWDYIYILIETKIQFSRKIMSNKFCVTYFFKPLELNILY